MHRSLTALGIVCILSGCAHDSQSSLTRDGAVADHLTPSAAQLLDKDGRFRVANLARAGEVSPERAQRLASAYMRTFGSFQVEQWRQAHGYDVDPMALEACGRPHYAESPYEPIVSDVIRPVRSAFGAWWIVTLCSRSSVPVVAVGVSAGAVDINVSPQGLLQLPPIRGNEFVAIPLHVELASDGEYLSPEKAAVVASTVTGRRVAEMPRLITGRFIDGGPFAGAWRVELESEVELQRSLSPTARVSTASVYVGRGGRLTLTENRRLSDRPELIVPLALQPSEEIAAILMTSDIAVPGSRGGTLAIRVKQNNPVIYEAATPTTR